MMIRFLVASITEPHFMSDYGLVVIAIAGALVYLGSRRALPSALLGPSDDTHPSSAASALGRAT